MSQNCRVGLARNKIQTVDRIRLKAGHLYDRISNKYFNSNLFI